MKFPFDNQRLVVEVVLAILVAAASVMLVRPLALPGLDGLAAGVVDVALLVLLAGPIVLWRIRRLGRGSVWTPPEAERGSPRPVRSVAIAAAVAVVGLIVAVTGAVSTSRGVDRVARAEFDRKTERLTLEAQRRVDQTRYGLAGARGVYAASESVEPAEFAAYVDSRDLKTEFPGAIGFGFIERVMRADLDAFVDAQRANGEPDFTVFGLAAADSELAAAEDLFVITQCFPRERNASAWGLDVGSERNRREAAERAVATGEPAISGRIILVQDGRRQTAFLYYIPVFRNGTAPATPAERQEMLVGLAYAPIILAEALVGAAESVEGDLDFEIFDGTAMTPDHLLFDHGIRPDEAPDARFTAVTPLEVGGRTWTMRTLSSPAFEAGIDNSTAIAIGFGGGLLSLMSGAFVLSLLGARSRAIALAEEMTRDLAAAKTMAEEAMRETDAFRSTLDAHSIISVADRSGRIIDANPPFCRISGYELEELIGQDHRILNSGLHPRSFWVELWRTLAAGESWRGEICNRARDGSLYWVDSVIAPFIGADGRVEKYVSIRNDITVRKQHEAELKAVAERLELATRAGGVGIWDLNLESGRLEWDDQMFRLYGASREEFLDEVASFDRALHPEDRDRVRAELQAAIRGEAEFDSEFRVVWPDGSTHWIHATAAVERDAIGEAIRMVGTNWDVTSEREAAEQLQAASQSLEDAQALARMGNWSVDLESGAAHWSRQLFELFGRDESAGPPEYGDAIALYTAETRAPLEAAIATALRDGTPYSLVMETAGDAPRARYVRAEGRVRRDAHGRIVGLFGTVMDVTAEVEAAASLREAQQQAEAANLAKSAFLANMSHEIRTPLTAILGFAELLRDDGSEPVTPKQRAQAVDTIRNAGQHLLTVINDILDLSKIEADRMTVERIETPLVAILREVESLMRPRAIGKGLGLTTVLEAEIPDLILGDPTRLRQILMNLVGNAVKFTEEGEVRIAVHVLQFAGADRRRIVVDIEDTGPGMSPDQADRLFQAFGQANETVTRKHGGTGLGLTICRRLAGLMGGTVTLQRTAPGKGSVFRLELPLEPCAGATMVADLRSVATTRPVDGAAVLRTTIEGRILLAEDGIDNQRLISFHLRKAGAEVAVADNGRIALEMIEAAEADGRPYDLLLTDMQMPEMDGYTLARTLRERGSTLPIIAVTAHAMAEDRERCRAAGCDDYASKPIERAQLIETCAAWIGRRGGGSAASRAA
jgi:PAS domain S-box-containing protein